MPTEQNATGARKVFDAFCEYLDEHAWKYNKDAQQLTISLNAKGDDLVIPVRISFDENLHIILLLSPMPFDVPEDMRKPMAVAVTAANLCIVDGSFDYNVENGKILYRITSSYRDGAFSKESLEYLLMCACVTTDKYNDKFKDIVDRKVSTDEMQKIIFNKED